MSKETVSSEFNYEIGFPAGGVRPGHHRSLRGGGGFEFREHRPLWADPDPRRLDVLQSLRDPFGELKVRTFRERRAIAVHVLADVSLSMGFGGKFGLLTEFAVCAAHSARRTGDAFGFMGAAETLVDELRTAPSHSKNAAALVADRLHRFTPSGRSSAGLREATEQVGRPRALVFLVSDFHCDTAVIASWLDGLTAHAVVPVVLWDPAEYTWPDRIGWSRVRDLETGRQRGVLLRPALSAKIRTAFRSRQLELRALFARYGARPLGIARPFDADRVSQFFADGDGWPDVAA